MDTTSSPERNLNRGQSNPLCREMELIVEGNELILRARLLGQFIRERVRRTISPQEGDGDKDEPERSRKQV